MKQVVILGAGAAGLGAGQRLADRGVTSILLEKADEWGGLCRNFVVEGFRFDTAIHLSFTTNAEVRRIFDASTPSLFHRPESKNYAHGHWIRHPVQTNLVQVPLNERIDIMEDLLAVAYSPKSDKPPIDYKEWLLRQFGRVFCERFSFPYTRKYWSVEAENLSVDWVGSRIYSPNVREILLGASTSETENKYYASEMRYPVSGGYRAYFDGMARKCDIRLGQDVCKVRPKRKEVVTRSGDVLQYDALISSLPLPVLVPLIEGVPDDVVRASQELLWTSVSLVSVGLRRPVVSDCLWFYIYDEDILPARCYSPSLKSPNNVPEGCGSLQFEIYSSRLRPLTHSNDELLEHVIQKGSQMGLFDRSEIAVTDVRHLPFGNVVFTHPLMTAREKIRQYLKSVEISAVGRFGEWDYLWSDQSILSGIKAADSLFSQ